MNTNYKVVMLDDFRAKPETPVGPGGRPRKYDEPTKGVSFRVPASLKQAACKKARQHRFNMTELLAVHLAQFVERPIEESRAIVQGYRAIPVAAVQLRKNDVR